MYFLLSVRNFEIHESSSFMRTAIMCLHVITMRLCHIHSTEWHSNKQYMNVALDTLLENGMDIDI